MVAAVSIPSSVTTVMSTSPPPSVARKRRRQILQSQRQIKAEAAGIGVSMDHDYHNDLHLAVMTSDSAQEPLVKKLCTADSRAGAEISRKSITLEMSELYPSSPPLRKVSDATCSPTASSLPPSPSAKTKKPQMRYEPDVPMTKDQAAVWRREQRRKRNRESAAASRQRQRDRIAELEVEVDGWKERFEQAMQRLHKLQALRPTASCTTPLPHAPNTSHDLDHSPEDSIHVSPCPSPGLSPCSGLDRSMGTEHDHHMDHATTHTTTENTNDLHFNETISRPAVKITDADHSYPPTVSVHVRDPYSDIIVPDLCSSMPLGKLPNSLPLSPIRTTVDDIVPTPLSPVSTLGEKNEQISNEELEFDEFLMDAAEWL